MILYMYVIRKNVAINVNRVMFKGTLTKLLVLKQTVKQHETRKSITSRS